MARPVKVRIAGAGVVRISETASDQAQTQELIKTLKEATLDSVSELKNIKRQMEALARRKSPEKPAEISGKYLPEIQE